MRKIFILFVIFTMFFTIDANSNQRKNFSFFPAFNAFQNSSRATKSFGFGLGFNYSLFGSDKNYVSVKASYFLPSSYNLTHQYYDENNNVYDATFNAKESGFLFNAAFQRYLYGEYQGDLAVYGMLGYQMYYSFNKISIADENVDYQSFVDGSKLKMFSKGLSLGVGVEKKVKAMFVFFEANYYYHFATSSELLAGLPETSGFLIPNFINLSAGLRIQIQ